ncbi:MAG: SusD/RagB family nutrient-binding outer membrane lipoprotein [Flavisolibacter sp.]
MKKFKISIIGLCLLVIAGGCKKSFFDINKDPNRATESSMSPDLMLAGQLNAIAGRNASTWDMLNRWMGYWSASGSYSRATVEMSYNITNTTMEGTWNNLYYVLNQLKTIETKAAEKDWKFYQGISKILAAHEWGVLVDLYGDVPFENALDLVENIRPTYTKGEDIYKALLPMIDEGLELIKAAGTDPNIGSQDILFGGNKTNWAKFANSLKLRLLLHAYKTNVFNAQAEIGKIQAEGSGFLGNGTGAMVQPGYTTDKPNPYYASHLHVINGNEADNYNRANCFALEFMKTTSDPRYTRFYRTAKALPGEYRCTEYGQNPEDDVNSDRTSGPGYGLIRVAETDFKTPPTAAGASGASQPMWLMTSVESMFLVAEATARGWLSGDAKAAYEAAVRESFDYLKLSSAEADTYLARSNPKIAWPTTGSLNDELAVIIWQKYYALNGLQANETWTDFRRLGIVQPPLSLAPERGSNPIPRRILYPSGEYSYNADNVPGSVNQFTSKIFWDL